MHKVLNLASTMGNTLLLHAVTRRLEGKVALITGGASGIGECTAKLFSQHGAKVVIADVQDELGHSVLDTIGSSSASYVHCDVTNESHVSKAVDTIITNYGKLDIIFNNASIVDPPKPRILDNELADFERVLKVKVTCIFLCTKHTARVMIPARSGNIISTFIISSVVAGAASHAYACSKHAVLGITKNAAMELGQFGIRVNCLSPHALSTPLAKSFIKLDDEALEKAMSYFANLKGVILKKEDVAQAALYFASEDSSHSEAFVSDAPTTAIRFSSKYGLLIQQQQQIGSAVSFGWPTRSFHSSFGQPQSLKKPNPRVSPIIACTVRK